MRKLDIAVPHGCERLIGFTIPDAGRFYICDHDRVWAGQIEPAGFELTDFSSYDFVGQRSDFLGIVFEDLSANNPILSAGGAAISYRFNDGDAYATVECRVGGRSAEVRFETVSRAWFAASLSHDGRHLVMADPYSLEVYEVTGVV